MEKFKLDAEYMTNVRVKYHYTCNGVEMGTVYHVDHPSFNALRKHLEYRGLIAIVNGCWNADHVLEDFLLNDHIFRKGDTFMSAGAMSYILDLNSSR